jgi:hypothetical protein
MKKLLILSLLAFGFAAMPAKAQSALPPASSHGVLLSCTAKVQ